VSGWDCGLLQMHSVRHDSMRGVLCEPFAHDDVGEGIFPLLEVCRKLGLNLRGCHAIATT
jgi:hypothetical protein